MQRYFGKEKKNGLFLLNESDLYHIRTVMRMKNNDQIEVVFEGKLYICELYFNKEETTISILTEKEDSIQTKDITLIIPVLKEQKMDLIIQKGAELGVSRIIPYIASRSVVKIDSGKEKIKIERWYKIGKEASEQSKRLDIPVIENIHTIKEVCNLTGLNIICSTTEKDKNIKTLLQSSSKCDKMNIIMGPEGGLTDKEEETLVEHGFIRVTLGKRIMRVETVPIFLLSIINYEYME